MEQGISVPPNVAYLEGFNEGHAADQIRLYDAALENWIKTFRLPPSLKDKLKEVLNPEQPLFIVFSTPRRGYGEMANLNNRQHVAQVRERDKIIRPIEPTCSITRRGIRRDASRWSQAHFRHAGFVDLEKKDIYQIPYPYPVNISYQLDFTSINRAVLNSIETWVLLQFNDDRFYLYVDPGVVHEGVYITKYAVPVVSEGVEDNSDLESVDGDRVLRLTLDLTIEGWLFRPARRMKTVHDVHIDVDP